MNNVDISPDLRDSFENSTVLAAAETYFMNNLMDVLQEKHLSAQRGIERSLAEEIFQESARRASKDMDDTPIEVTLGDHCLHWHITLAISIEGKEKVVSDEIPLFKTRCDRMHMLHPMTFLMQFLDWAAREANEQDEGDPGINPGKIMKVSRRIEELLETCEACKNLVTLTEVIFKDSARGPNAFFCFRVATDDGIATGALTFELPWPLV